GSALGINTNSSQAVTVGGALTANSTASIKGGTVTLDHATSNVVSWGTAGSNTPSSSSTGWKAKTYGNQSGIGISSSAQWYASNGSHVWYSTSDSGTTFTQRMSLDNAGLLTATGAIQPSVGNSTSYGIQFAQNYGGGSGDSAFLRYYVDDSTENMRLILGIDNDTDDDLVLYQGGSNRIQLASGEIYMLTKVGYGSCPSNYTLSNNLCYRRYSSGKTWMEAQSTCHSDGGHVCTMAEAYIIWGSSSCSAVHSTGDWLGDIVTDDYPLGVSNNCSKSNFEYDEWNKTDTRSYVCCLNIR
ncbi:MAG: C-type lectin domain-containing protein, partial [Myxococcales bacterium]|nr:C-type lectin domain-containing protein [Myxococcales bacterium]